MAKCGICKLLRVENNVNMDTKILVRCEELSFIVDRMNNLVYEDKPKYDSWLKFLLGGVLALTFILGVVLNKLSVFNL